MVRMGEKEMDLGQLHDLAAKTLLKIGGICLAGKGQDTRLTAHGDATFHHKIGLMHVEDTAVDKIP